MVSNKVDRHCCTMERKRLLQVLRTCDYCTTDYDEYQRCYESAARESGERSKACMASR